MEIDNQLREVLKRETLTMAAKNRAVGGFAGVVSDGKLTWQQTFGFADLETKRVPEDNSAFRIASVTKTFTSVAIFQLRDAGKLSIEDSVTEHIPELAKSPDVRAHDAEITIRRLLSHTAGINTHTPVGRPYFSDNLVPALDEVLDKLELTRTAVEPGTKFKYSNFGFGLLGEIVRRVSGQPAEDYIVEKICEPLGMDSTLFKLTPEIEANAFIGYQRLDYTSDVRKVDHVELRFEDPAGGLYSTPHDLAIWAGFHLSKEENPVLSLASRAEMREPQDVPAEGREAVCMNWMMNKVEDTAIFSHGGGLPGYATTFCIVPDLGVGAFSLVNTWKFQDSIGKRLAEVMIKGGSSTETSDESGESGEIQDMPEVRLAEDPPDSARDFTGIYLFDTDVIMWVEWWNGGLSARVNEQGRSLRARLTPTEAADRLVIEEGPFEGDEIVMERDENGEVSGCTWGGFRLIKMHSL